MILQIRLKRGFLSLCKSRHLDWRSNNSLASSGYQLSYSILGGIPTGGSPRLHVETRNLMRKS